MMMKTVEKSPAVRIPKSSPSFEYTAQNLLRTGKWECLRVKSFFWWPWLQEAGTAELYWIHSIMKPLSKRKIQIPHLTTQKKGYNKILDVQLKQVKFGFGWKQPRRVSPLNCILIKPFWSSSVERGEVMVDTDSRVSNSKKMANFAFFIHLTATRYLGKTSSNCYE